MILDGERTVHRYTCKAFGVGADFVVMGGALAGIQTNEACERFMLFHGMSSKRTIVLVKRLLRRSEAS